MKTRPILLAAGLILSSACPAFASGTADQYRKSYALEAKSDYAGALAALEPIAARGGGDYLYQLRTGWLLYLAGRQSDSVGAYQRAIAAAPSAVEPRLGILLPLMAAGRWKDAEKEADEVLKLAPTDMTALGRLAYIHYNLGLYERAESEYRRVLAAYPGNVEMRAGLGWSLLKRGRKAEARREFRQVLEVAPDQKVAKAGWAAAN